MLEFEKAPYLELENYKAPKGINCIFIPMPDGKKVRLAFWKISDTKKKCRGTVLLQQGHNEFIEKYYETIQEFIDRNFNVVAFDWRGQGMSERMIEDIHKQYIEDFKIHDKDLQFIIEEIVFKFFEPPVIAIGHSMGGCIVLSSLKYSGKKFEKIILSAPMLGFKNEKFLMPLIDVCNLIFSKERYMLWSKPNMGKEVKFENNDLTNDLKRYTRTLELVRKRKDIRLWGVTIAFSIAVKRRLIELRKKGWAENIDSKILFINSLNDKVVSSKHIIEMSKRLPNSKLINFNSCQHEIFMERDIYRNEMWRKIDYFLELSLDNHSLASR